MNIPSQLCDLDQWVCWRYEGDDARKIPYTPGSDRRASSVDPSTWRSLQDAEADRRYSGIGFVFSDDDPYVGIDIDDCIGDDGMLLAWARELIEGLPTTYSEVSPSGRGLKLWVMGELPSGGKRKRKIGGGMVEIYARGRYFTVTGDVWQNRTEIAHATALANWYEQTFGARTAPRPRPTASSSPIGGYEGSDESLIAAIRRSSRADRFDKLWRGSLGDYDGDWSSADQALCNMLAWWCGPNPERVERLWAMSGLSDRKKFDRKDYRERTISSAIDSCDTFYKPKDVVPVNHDSDAFKRAREDRPYAMTDIGNAERLAAHFKGRIVYCGGVKSWYVYDGRKWEKDDDKMVEYLAIRTIRMMHDEADLLEDDDRADRLRDHAGASEAGSKITAMVKIASSLPTLVVRSSAFDSDPWLLNCRNGTVDIRDGKLRPHNSDDMITKMCDASYIPNAMAPTWSRFLDWAFLGNVELVDYVQELMGYCATGVTSEQIMPVFYGEGANGKSTLWETINRVLGDYSGKTAPDLLMAKRNEAHPTEIADLWGKRLAIASEPEGGCRLKSSVVKEMTGDTTLKARYMHGNFFEFDTTHKLLLVTNHKPIIREQKAAIWRRLKLIPFDARISDAEKDGDLGSKLMTERHGILAWIVEGARRWSQRGHLDDPAEVIDATEEYRVEEENPVVDFINGLFEFTGSKEDAVAISEIRTAYHKYCDELQLKPIGDRSLLDAFKVHPGVKSVQKRLQGRNVKALNCVRKRM